MDNELLKKVKNSLSLLGDYEDEYILEIIERGKSRLDDLMGVPLDYAQKENEELLIDYCRYAYNNVLEYFEENFQSEIVRRQLTVAMNEKDSTKGDAHDHE